MIQYCAFHLRGVTCVPHFRAFCFKVCTDSNADVLLNACKDIGLAVNIGKTKYMEIGRHRGVIASAHIKIVIPMKKWKRLNT